MSLQKEMLWPLPHKKVTKGYARHKRFFKRQMNKFIRLQSKDIDSDDVDIKTNRKPYKKWDDFYW